MLITACLTTLVLKQGLTALGLLAGLSLVCGIIWHYMRVIIKKEKQQLQFANQILADELRINRSLMDPHFVFNALNTLHNYILMSNVEKASDYLIRLSMLIRKLLAGNLSGTITLEQETDLIKSYLEIETLRFKGHIQCHIHTDPRIAPSFITLPVMMLLPFVENAIWHGLSDKKDEKMITITFNLKEKHYLECSIDDNGTGRKKKNNHTEKKTSTATAFIKQRLDLLNKIHNLKADLCIVDKPNGQGTTVILLLPILNK